MIISLTTIRMSHRHEVIFFRRSDTQTQPRVGDTHIGRVVVIFSSSTPQSDIFTRIEYILELAQMVL